MSAVKQREGGVPSLHVVSASLLPCWLLLKGKTIEARKWPGSLVEDVAEDVDVAVAVALRVVFDVCLAVRCGCAEDSESVHDDVVLQKIASAVVCLPVFLQPLVHEPERGHCKAQGQQIYQDEHMQPHGERGRGGSEGEEKRSESRREV